MVDFTNCPINKFKAYGGANGNKINITYNGESYMLKFPPEATKNKLMSYANSCISEHISCQILKSMGFDVQETILGTFTNRNGKTHIVVACKDFTSLDTKLIEFAELKNACVDSLNNGYGTEFSNIMAAIEEQELIPVTEMKDYFWRLFIADALLGNFDRHNGNWGVLVNEQARIAKLAPVYDCGSCLYPQILTTDMEQIITDDAEIDKRIFVYPTSTIKYEDKKISYFDFISSHKYEDCSNALVEVAAKINMVVIEKIIDETPSITDTQKRFYKTMIKSRKERIIDFSIAKLNQNGAEFS